MTPAVAMATPQGSLVALATIMGHRADGRCPMRRARRGLWMVGAWLTAMAAACGPSGSSGGAADQDGRPGVVCTTAMVGDVVAGVGGDLVGVRVLMGPGVDPHLYRPTRSDIAAIMSADRSVLNGHMLEGKMSETLGRAASGARRSGRSPSVCLRSTCSSRTRAAARPIRTSGWTGRLVRDDPDREGRSEAILPGESERLAGQAVAYAAEIDRLHATHSACSRRSRRCRILVTSHDASATSGGGTGSRSWASRESQRSPRRACGMERIIELLVSRRIGAVFVETTVSDRNIRAAIEGAAARHTVVVGVRSSPTRWALGTYEDLHRDDRSQRDGGRAGARR